MQFSDNFIGDDKLERSKIASHYSAISKPHCAIISSTIYITTTLLLHLPNPLIAHFYETGDSTNKICRE